MRAQIVLAGGLLKSFATAALALRSLANVTISERHVGRLVEEIGGELERQRDEQAEAHRHRRLEPQVETAPSLVGVEVDGGRLQTRGEGAGPGAHAAGWREDKVACLVTLHGETFAADPQPEPPARFLDPPQVAALVRGVHGGGSAAQESAAEEPLSAEAAERLLMEPPPADDPPAWQPERLVRTCVATLADSVTFGALVAAEAQRRNFGAAARGVFVADGQHCNWTLHQRWFRDYVAVTDFIHVLGYVYAAAGAVAAEPDAAWSLYENWLRACWQGRVAEVLDALRAWQERHGTVGPDETAPTTDPRLVVERTRTYLENNQQRMNYPQYRQAGLPITSAWVESLIKEVNYRVKGSEKFWSEHGGEQVLQVRAALLSQDDRLVKYLAHRLGQAHRRRAA